MWDSVRLLGDFSTSPCRLKGQTSKVHIISETIQSSGSCQCEECKVFKKDLLAGTGCQIPTSPHKQAVAQLLHCASEYRFSKLCLVRIPKKCQCITELKMTFYFILLEFKFFKETLLQQGGIGTDSTVFQVIS